MHVDTYTHAQIVVTRVCRVDVQCVCVRKRGAMLQDPVSPLPFLASLSLPCNVEVREQRLREHAREKEKGVWILSGLESFVIQYF